jgi:hypothetical protein
MAFMERACPSTQGRPSWTQRSASQYQATRYAVAHDELVMERGGGLEERIRTGFHSVVEHDLPVVIADTGIHGADMQIDAAVKLLVMGENGRRSPPHE